MRHRMAPLILLVALAAACDSGVPGRMVQLPPPPNWEQGIEQGRTMKDEWVRTGEDSPLLAGDKTEFQGLEYWPPASGYYRVGSITFYPQPERLEMITTAGKVRPAEKVGWVEFELEGQVLRLQVYRLGDQRPTGEATDFFLPFKDATSGNETYPSGRYVNLQGPVEGPFVLDFNMAHNPYCAYGEPGRFACPVTPADNHLQVRIEAGERGYRKEEASGT